VTSRFTAFSDSSLGCSTSYTSLIIGRMASTQLIFAQKPVLPRDICGIVIDMLASQKGNQISVKQCSCVSRSFLHLCRKHLFATRKVNNHAARKKLTELIDHTPAIGNYIRHFELSVKEGDTGPGDFLRTLQRLTKVESLTLWHGDVLDWRDLLWPVRNALLRLIYLPTLTTLTLSSVDKFLVADLVHATNLRCLKFSKVYDTTFFQDSTDAAPVAPMILPEKSLQLRELLLDSQAKVSGFKEITNARRFDGLPVIDLTALASVSVQCFNVDDMGALRTFLKQCEHLAQLDLTSKTFLRLLNLFFLNHIISVPSNFAFAGFGDIITPHIRVLKIASLSQSPDPNHDIHLGSIPSELAKIAGANVVELTIEVTLWDSSADEWGRLDTALTSSKWPALKTFLLKIRVLSRHGPEIDRMAESFEQVRKAQFPRLLANQSVNFRIELKWLRR
jgi:hypothetical protein